MPQLYNVGNPIDREERANLNLTFDDIQRRFSLLQSQVNFLSGGADIEGLLTEINQAIINAQNSTENVDAALITIDNKLQELELEIEKAQELKPLGEWNSTTNYKKLNIVYLDGNSYIAKVDNINVNPSDTNTWTLFASKGDTGRGLSIKGSLIDPSQLPPASNYDEGDAFYVGQDLYVKIDSNWENVGQIKGDPGSDANVTATNIESALGYVPADKEELDNFKDQYEFRTPTISGRQILINKPDDSNRIPILLSNEIVEGNKITVSTDSGSTSVDLKNIDGNDVTKLEKGFHELIYTGSFFTLRNLSGGVNQSQLDELIRLVNEADLNDSTLRSEFISVLNSSNLNSNSTWNEILLELELQKSNSLVVRNATKNSLGSQQTFTSQTGGSITAPGITINALSDFNLRSIQTMIITRVSNGETTTWNAEDLYSISANNRANCVYSSNFYRVPFSTGNFNVPVSDTNVSYKIIAIGVE